MVISGRWTPSCQNGDEEVAATDLKTSLWPKWLQRGQMTTPLDMDGQMSTPLYFDGQMSNALDSNGQMSIPLAIDGQMAIPLDING